MLRQSPANRLIHRQRPAVEVRGPFDVGAGQPGLGELVVQEIAVSGLVVDAVDDGAKVEAGVGLTAWSGTGIVGSASRRPIGQKPAQGGVRLG